MKRKHVIALAAVLAIALSCAGCATMDEPAATSSQHSGDGIGGTGIDSDPDGIGGTGVVGVIAGLDGIVINGIRIDYSKAVAVEINARSATAEDLRIGQVARVLADEHADGLRARHIEVIDAVVGPVGALDRAHGELQVLGQMVRLDPAVLASSHRDLAPVLQTLVPGDRVRVSGLRRDDGIIIATRIEAARADELDVVSGVAGAPTATGFRISALQVDEGPGAERVRTGQSVLVVGRLQGDVLRAETVRVQPSVPFDGRAQRLLIEGYAATTPRPDRVRVGGTTAMLTRGTRFEGTSTPTSMAGKRVVLSARVSPGRVVQAERVAPARPAVALPGRVTSPPSVPEIQRPESVRPMRPEPVPAPSIQRPVRPEAPVRPDPTRPAQELIRPALPPTKDVLSR